MTKVLFIASIGLGKNAEPNGVNIKNRHIMEYLIGIKNINLKIIDTENWKKKIILLFFDIFISSFTNKKIILSINSKSAYKVIKFLYFFKLDKKLIYFVVGGNLPEKIQSGEFKYKYYKEICTIYVETHKMAGDLKKMNISNVERLPNFKYFKKIAIPKNKKINVPIKCFYLGRIHPDKGIDMIFESFKVLNHTRKKFIIDFYGPIQKDYKDLFLEKINIYEFSIYKGVIDLIDSQDNYYILSNYDLFIFPTYWEGEGFPGVIIDSFISGVPVLASDWKHNGEIIKDGYNGIIFESKNVKDLISKLNYIYNNSDILVEMSKNAHKSAEKYRAENILKVLTDVL